jgi:hypothetical protein
VNFEQQKVSRGGDSGNEYLNHILDLKTKRLFQCLLETNCNCKTHVVDIDCTKRIVYDCKEENSLHLSKPNLNHCCGKDTLGLKRL